MLFVEVGGGRKILGNHMIFRGNRGGSAVAIMNGGGGGGKEGGRGIIRKLQKHNLNHSAPPPQAIK